MKNSFNLIEKKKKIPFIELADELIDFIFLLLYSIVFQRNEFIKKYVYFVFLFAKLICKPKLFVVLVENCNTFINKNPLAPHNECTFKVCNRAKFILAGSYKNYGFNLVFFFLLFIFTLIKITEGTS